MTDDAKPRGEETETAEPDDKATGSPTRRVDRDRAMPAHPERVGPYRILQVLGEGGMGTVYEAEQTETVTRRVALKVVKLGMDTRDVVARFEAERQALALMDHPGIARVLDGGATDDGRPFFVMELVRGVPLSLYCDRAGLSTRQRLELFVQLCHAVQHAHQKGIIHRDLKPSNVLVAEHDGRSDLKVIDFGVAKAVGAKLTDQTFVTRLGEAIGTPAYMSPEQAERSALDVDTRTDVYSLGVILYEMLVGTLPVDWESEGARTYLDRLARHETAPPTPSTRLSGLGARASDVAKARQTSLKHLRSELQGDLDWVVMKAMETDRARRYETVNGLAADVERFLAGEPVVARPPSAAYRARKFVRRHRVGVAAACAVLLAVVLGLLGTAYGLVRARTERAAAEREATTARAALDFMVNMFGEADPMALHEGHDVPASSGKPLGETLTAKAILERGAEQLETRLADEPLARAKLLHALGRVNRSLGLHDAAEKQLREALDLRERELGSENDLVSVSLISLAKLQHERRDFVGMKATSERAVAMREKAHGPDDAGVGKALSFLGDALMHLGDLAGARRVLERARAIETAAARAEHRPEFHSNVLALVMQGEGDLAGARALLEEALESSRERYGSEHPEVGVALNNLAEVVGAQGDLAEARRLHEEGLEIDRRTLGPEHPDVARRLNNLALVMREQGDLDGARAAAEDAVAIARKALGTENAIYSDYLHTLAEIVRNQGDLPAALPLHEEALAIRRRVRPPDDPHAAISASNLGEVVLTLGDPARAQELFEEALAIDRRALGPESREAVLSLQAAARAMMARQDWGGAAACLEDVIAIDDRAHVLEPLFKVQARYMLGTALRLTGDLRGSLTRHEEGLELRRRTFGGLVRDNARSLVEIGMTLKAIGDFEGARASYQEALDFFRQTVPPGDPEIAYPLARLGRLGRDTGDLVSAERYYREALPIFERARGFGPNHAMPTWIRADLCEILRNSGRAAEADRLLAAAANPTSDQQARR